MKQAVTAEANLQDVAALIASMRKNSEPLIHCAVFIELSARDPDSLRALRDEVTSELIRSKLGADPAPPAPAGGIPLLQSGGPQHLRLPV